MDQTQQILIEAELGGLSALYRRAHERGILETGSSSIAPKYREACDCIITRSHEVFGFIPRGLSAIAMWRQLGDPSAMFYFGGKRYLDGQWREVNVTEHIALLAGSLDMFDIEHIRALDEVTGELTRSIGRLPT